MGKNPRCWGSVLFGFCCRDKGSVLFGSIWVRKTFDSFKSTDYTTGKICKVSKVKKSKIIIVLIVIVLDSGHEIKNNNKA